MPRTDIRTWASAAEIIASVAVVASLIFVVISLRQNTAALQLNNDRFIYELQDQRLAIVSDNAELAELIVKARAGEELSDVEQLRYDFWVYRDLNAWEIAFSRHAVGLMPPSQWIAWDESFRDSVIRRLPEESWNRLRTGYGDGFKNHIDSVYAEMQRSTSN